MEKIILFYKFAPIIDPEAIRLWQRELCESAQLKGRIIISTHGINGTLAGDLKGLKRYIKATKQFKPLQEIDFKWNAGTVKDFPRLSIKVRDEIVTFGAINEIVVDEKGIVGGGTHLKPEQVHQLVEERGDEVVFFDGRNAYEAKVGRFKGAVVPPIDHTREFKAELSKPEYDSIKNKPVVTYCTGGIRCEVLSMLMKKRGFKEVYQIDGGIKRYGETFGDQGLWEGSLYVFDGRMGVKFTDQAVDIGTCIHCGDKSSNYENCANKACNKLVLICLSCKDNQTYCQECALKTA